MESTSRKAQVIEVGSRDLWVTEPEHSISVSALAGLVKVGDLTSTDAHRVTAREGIKTHLAIQKRRPSPYIAEQTIRYRCETALGVLEIRGRMDGWMPAYAGIDAWVEEIKTSRQAHIETPAASHTKHADQLQWYAWMILCLDQSESVAGQLTYVHPDSLREIPVRFEWCADQLRDFVAHRINAWVKYQRMIRDWREARDHSLARLAYPMNGYRPHQRTLATTVYRAISGKIQQTWVEAPTGLGKTIGVLFPAVKAFPSIQPHKIFYFTAKVDGQRSAEATLKLFHENHDLRLASTTITAKRTQCPNPELPCDPNMCAYARGYYDRVDAGLDALRSLKTEQHVDTTQIGEIAEKYQLCPFELNLDFARECDVIIADYNYGFDPRVKLKRFFDTDQKDHIFLIDEAHNLMPRSIDMFSEVLRLEPLIDASASIVERGRLQSALDVVVQEVRRLIKARPNMIEWLESPLQLEHLKDLVVACLGEMAISYSEDQASMSVLEAWWMLDRFCDRLLDLSVTDRIIIQQQPEPCIVLACIEPGPLLQDTLSQARNVVAFSATLRPRSWIESRLAVPSAAKWFGFPSPFNQEHQFTAIIRDVDVRYQSRDQSLPKLVSLIHLMVTARQGNYLVFCPSYAFLSQLATQYQETYPQFAVVKQEPHHSREEIKQFVQSFQGPTSVLGFAVLGGRYAESIDFKGEQLIGAMIIGLGLAPRSALGDAMSELHRPPLGYDTSYRYPALLKTIQTAGRVIRSADDRGIILLIDDRFEQKQNKSQLPSWWQVRSLTTKSLEHQLRLFWSLEQDPVSTQDELGESSEPHRTIRLELTDGRNG